MNLESEVTKALRRSMSAPVAEKVAPAVTIIPSPAMISVPEGATLFSAVFGYVPSFGDFPVTVLPPSPNPDMARLVPAVDPDYVVQQEECARIVAGVVDNDRIMITGPTGSGKSSLIKYVAAKLNWPFLRINMSGDVESAHILGTREVKDGATTWADGAVAEAVKGGALCLVDEWELMPAEIAMNLQNLLEDGGYLYLKEKPGSSEDRTYIPHANFRIMFAGNTVGQGDTTGAFTGTRPQNKATIDRFSAVVKLDYLTKDHEAAILTGKGVDKGQATSMVEFAALVRNAYNGGKVGLTISPRTLINWGRKSGRYGVAKALDVCFMEKLTEDDRTSLGELYRKVFG